MINELYTLSSAMQTSDISGRTQHPSYHPLRNVKKDDPCLQILLSGSKVVGLRSLSRETVAEVRKYGDKHGSYPAMNLAPLYRVIEENAIRTLNSLRNGKTTGFDLEQLKRWCQVDNWSTKFLKKYKLCFQKAEELRKKLQSDPESPIHTLCRQTECFQDSSLLHKALETRAFQMLEEKKDIPTAIQILFHFGKAEQDAIGDFGNLSVVLDSTALADAGYSTTTAAFTQRLNDALLKADADEKNAKVPDTIDAFGTAFAAVEKPMPEVKLPGGFTVSLRTMFREQECQFRYGRIENATYPIAPSLQLQLKSALEWISSEERKNITWTSLNKDEILFAYPEGFPSLSAGVVSVFRRTPDKGASGFQEAAKRFLTCLREAKEPTSDSKADQIQIFILRKLDKARTKIVYTYNTTPQELEQRSEAWWIGCHNVPDFTAPFITGSDYDLFPLEVTRIMNNIWKRDGTLVSDKFKPFCSSHGLDLFFGRENMARRDLSVLLHNLEPVAITLGSACQVKSSTIVKNADTFHKSFLLLGLLLDQLENRKEQYMQEFPYLYGQLLKISDALHILYCRVVRGEKQIPAQLVGGSLYHAALEMPLQTLAQLGQRMNPYILWAKSYQYQKVSEKGRESWMAGWYLRLYESIASQLATQPKLKAKLSEAERAQLFIGYLAAFPKRGQGSEYPEKNINGGIDDER